MSSQKVTGIPWGCCAGHRVALVLSLVNFRIRLLKSEVESTQVESTQSTRLNRLNFLTRLNRLDSRRLKTTPTQLFFFLSAVLLRVTTAAAPLHCCSVRLRSALLCSTRFRHALLKICWEMRSHQAVSPCSSAVTQAKAPVVLIDTVRPGFFRCCCFFFAAALYY